MRAGEPCSIAKQQQLSVLLICSPVPALYQFTLPKRKPFQYLRSTSKATERFSREPLLVEVDPFSGNRHGRHGLSEQQHLDKEVLEVGQEGFAEGGDGIVVGVQIPSNEAERGRFALAGK